MEKINKTGCKDSIIGEEFWGCRNSALCWRRKVWKNSWAEVIDWIKGVYSGDKKHQIKNKLCFWQFDAS